MQLIVIAAAVLTVLILAGVVRLVRTFSVTCISYAQSVAAADVSWRDYPLARLLDPADFEFLRSRGISERQIQKLRSERRKLMRRCLRSLAQDFNELHMTLKLAIVYSKEDRPELAKALAMERFVFYRNLLKVEGWLVLHALGFDSMPSVDLLLPLNALQAQLRELTAIPAMTAAGA